MKVVKTIVLIVMVGSLTGALVSTASWSKEGHESPEVAVSPTPVSQRGPEGGECPGTHLERNVCYIRVVFQNNERKVFSHDSDIMEECSCAFGAPVCIGGDDCHSCPFGNWGVDSAYGSRSNTTQFRGWQSVDSSSKREWNSCTGDFEYYNNGPEQQRQADWPNDPRQWAGGWLEWELEEGPSGGCAELDGVNLSLGNVGMDLWELDLLRDDFVDWITYPTHVITLDCPNEDTCDGSSPWYLQNGEGNEEITAKSRAIITGSYFETECIEQ